MAYLDLNKQLLNEKTLKQHAKDTENQENPYKCIYVVNMIPLQDETYVYS